MKLRWAVCPRPTVGADLLPNWFRRQADAWQWRDEVVVKGQPMGSLLEVGEESVGPAAPVRGTYCPEIRRRDQGWQEVVPISWLGEQVGSAYAGRRLQDFLPLDSVACKQAFNLSADVSEALDGYCPKLECDLGTDWGFEVLVASARRGAGHAFRGRRLENLAPQMVRIAYDLETALWRHHGALSAPAVASFWTSWRVWQYLSVWGEQVAEEWRLQESAQALPDSTGVAVWFLYRQLWFYAAEVRNWRPTPEQGEDVGKQDIGSLDPKRRRTKRETYILRALHQHNIATFCELARLEHLDPATVWRWSRGKNTQPGRKPSDARIRLLRRLDLKEADIPE